MVTADMPGAEPDSIDVSFENGVLTLRGTAPEIERERRPGASEFRTGDFERTFEISDRIEVEAIEARLRHGVLRVRLPKGQPTIHKVTVVTD